MILTSLEGRYARTLFDFSTYYEENLHILENTLSFFKKHVGLYRLLSGITLSKKNRFLLIESISHALCFSEEIEIFFKLLVERNRINKIKNIVTLYRDLVDAAINRHRVTVESAHPLMAEEKKRLEKELDAYFDCQTIASYVVSPHLLGGFAVRDKRFYFDVSFKAQLRRLELTLQGAL